MSTHHLSVFCTILMTLHGSPAVAAEEPSPALHGSILGTIAGNTATALTETTPDPGLEAQRQFLEKTHVGNFVLIPPRA